MTIEELEIDMQSPKRSHRSDRELSFKMATVFNEKGWLTTDVCLLAKKYLGFWKEWWGDYEADRGNFETYENAVYQLRCLLSDALRDAGCHVEVIHEFIFTAGFYLSESIHEITKTNGKL